MEQLPLDITIHSEATFENFCIGPNGQLVSDLKLVSKGQGPQFIYLWGSKASGCSHLLQAVCHEAFSHDRHGAYIPLSKLEEGQIVILEGLERTPLVCIDDVSFASGKPAWQEALFHLFNRMRDAGGNLIIVGNAAPKDLEFDLQDLVSRLLSGWVYQLQVLSDEERLDVLKIRAKRRGVNLPDEVGIFMLNHCSRNMADLMELFDQLERASLVEKRKITVPFVKSVIEI